jgi:predicted SAM-dependent methyltransferase
MSEVRYECGKYKVNLGCGNKKEEGFLGIDISEHSSADIVHDLRKGIPLCSNSAEYIKSINFLEHITSDEFIGLMWEVWRVLKNEGVFYSETAYGNSNTRWQDPTHKNGFTVKTFDYFETDSKHQKLYNLPPFYKIKTSQIGEIIKVEMRAKK